MAGRTSRVTRKEAKPSLEANRILGVVFWELSTDVITLHYRKIRGNSNAAFYQRGLRITTKRRLQLAPETLENHQKSQACRPRSVFPARTLMPRLLSERPPSYHSHLEQTYDDGPKVEENQPLRESLRKYLKQRLSVILQ
jgi:hypothetical protein